MAPKNAKAAAATTKSGGKTKVADEDKVKRAPSPYIIFCTEKRPEVKANNPTASFGELGKLLGELWRGLDEHGKAPYVKDSAARKAALEK